MSTFDFLSGSIRVNATAPAEWEKEHILPFWLDPNNEKWGRTLCRVLYHETIHFWQLLSSGYLANLVAEDWKRLLDYEKTGQLNPITNNVHQFSVCNGNIPFSNSELVETWARYWDVHTRSPARIMEEENIDAGKGIWEIFPNESTGGPAAYTNNAFDAVMQLGIDCKTYGRPYRWLLESFHNHSAFVALLFPIIAHAAFGCPEPALVFCSAFDRAWNSKTIRDRINQRSGSINLDWLNLWPTVINEVVEPVLIQQRFGVYTSGLTVIERGILQTHPVFYEYLDKVMVRGFLKMYSPAPRSNSQLDLVEAQALSQAPELDAMIPFAFPGQPFYRRMLGEIAPPPSIKFDNFSWYAHRPVMLKVMAASEGKLFQDTYAELSTALEKRVLRLRVAEKAVSLGLTANHFEKENRAGI